MINIGILQILSTQLKPLAASGLPATIGTPCASLEALWMGVIDHHTLVYAVAWDGRGRWTEKTKTACHGDSFKLPSWRNPLLGNILCPGSLSKSTCPGKS